MVRFIAGIVVGIASASFAQTYTWTGGGGIDIRWSNASNWEGGLVPVSSAASTIVFPQSIASEFAYESSSDLGTIDVGTLKLLGGALGGSTFRVHHRVEAGTFPEWWSNLQPSIEVAGDVTFQSAHLAPPPGAGPIGAKRINSLSGNGNATFHGAWQAFPLTFSGDLFVAEDGLLSGFAASTQSLRSLRVNGLLDLVGTFTLPQGAVADVASGALDLARADNTLGTAGSGTLQVAGDFKLGEYAVAGSTWSVDRLEVTGTLDLTAASLVPQNGQTGWYGWPSQSGAEYVTIATYGNRIGEFASNELSALLIVPHFSTLQVVYTSPENAGPGEIRVLLPEPSIFVTVAAGALLVRRRREQ